MAKVQKGILPSGSTSRTSAWKGPFSRLHTDVPRVQTRCGIGSVPCLGSPGAESDGARFVSPLYLRLQATVCFLTVVRQ